MEWEELNPQLQRITVWKEQRQVTRAASTTLAGGQYPLRGLSVVQAQVKQCQLTPLSPLTSKAQKVTNKCAHQIHTWDASYPTGTANATKSY